MMSAPSDRLLTPEDVARRLAVSRSMIYTLIRRGELAAVYIGRLPRVTEAALADYLATASAR
jgi:excisionase family DNA binding protein